MTDGAEQFDPLAEFEDEEPTNEETYAALRRSIARTAGFGQIGRASCRERV